MCAGTSNNRRRYARLRCSVVSGSHSDPRRTHCENGQCCIQRGNQGRREDGERVQGEDARFCEDSMLVIFSRSRCSCVTSANRRQLFKNHKESAFGLTTLSSSPRLSFSTSAMETGSCSSWQILSWARFLS